MGTIFAQPVYSDPNPTSPSPQLPSSDDVIQPLSHAAVESQALPILSTPSTSLLESTPPPPHPSAPPASPIPHVHVPNPKAFNVPPNLRQILDLSSSSTTPESIAKRALLSNDPSKNAVALVGMGGTGKTTILRALGRDSDVMSKFTDGIWFFELGYDVKLSSFIRQLQTLVKYAFPDFLEDFKELAADENTHHTMMTQLMDRLTSKCFLLLFDDVWDVNPSVYKLVYAVYTAVQWNDSVSLKILTSTRSEDVGDAPAHEICIAVDPSDFEAERSVSIFCCYACIDVCEVLSLTVENRYAMNRTLETCGGLPLALSVAGSAVKQLMAPSVDVSKQNAFVRYWERLQSHANQLSKAEIGERHKGLSVALESSLDSLEKKWKGETVQVRDMFQSLCVLQKQMCLPLSVIAKLWGVTSAVAQEGVMMFARNSLVSLVWTNGEVSGMQMHDLVHDISVDMAESDGGSVVWHRKLLDAYGLSANTPSDGGHSDRNGVSGWWDLAIYDKYMSDNLVRHMLDAGRIPEALQLLTDYRWVERMNEDQERPPFQKVIGELQLLVMHLEKYERTETGRRLVYDISVIVRTMELCVTLKCMGNRDECTFQLYGRLCGVQSGSGVVERIVWGIEVHGRRPWARAGSGVLTSGKSPLKRVLEPEFSPECMSFGVRADEVIIGGYGGQICVLNGRDGSKMVSLIGHDEEDVIVDVFADRSSGLIYSCTHMGSVILWNRYKKMRCLQAEGINEDELVICMQVLEALQKVVLFTTEGQLLVMDVKSGSTMQTIDLHTDDLGPLAVVHEADVLVSGYNGNIVVWETETFEDNGVLFNHPSRVLCVTLSSDGKLLAFGSDDGTVRLWDLPVGEQVWKSEESDLFVRSVQFSRDERLLYSANFCKICVWRVSDGGREVTFLHTLRHSTMDSVVSLRIGDNWELFARTDNHIYVWDAREVASDSDEVGLFLPAAEDFGVSTDGATIVIRNGSQRIQIRNVFDVLQRTDHIVSEFTIPDPASSLRLAVSNDQHIVIYSACFECVLLVVNAHNGAVMHTLTSLKDWAESATPDQRNTPLAVSSLDDSTIPTTKHAKYLESLCLDSDNNIVSAVIRVQWDGMNWKPKWKSMSWNVLSGELLNEPLLDSDGEALSNTASPRLFSKQSMSIYDRDVIYEHNGESFTIATLEHNIIRSHYCANTSRLWASRDFGGLDYVDLITDSTELAARDEPSLPVLSQPDGSPSQHEIDDTGGDTEAEEVYDVFISHAGPDKYTIAKPLYDLLVALGFKVFLDIAELKPGQNAPEKMFDAMRTAKIAVVILSPEFAARNWTLKELMCFLERYRVGGEHGVVIIPVFYRLTLNDCRDQKSLFGLRNESGENVFVAEWFLERMAEEEYGVGDVLKALQWLRSLTGIENKGGVTNGSSAEEKRKQKEFVEEIAGAIEEAMTRF